MSEENTNNNEIVEQSDVPQVQTQTKIVAQEFKYYSPIPPPEMLKGYKEVNSSFPTIIMEEFKRNSEHIRSQEKAAIEIKEREVKRGQYMAFFISVMLLGVVITSLILDNSTFAGVSGLAFFAFLAKSFLPNKTNDDKK